MSFSDSLLPISEAVFSVSKRLVSSLDTLNTSALNRSTVILPLSMSTFTAGETEKSIATLPFFRCSRVYAPGAAPKARFRDVASALSLNMTNISDRRILTYSRMSLYGSCGFSRIRHISGCTISPHVLRRRFSVYVNLSRIESNSCRLSFSTSASMRTVASSFTLFLNGLWPWTGGPWASNF